VPKLEKHEKGNDVEPDHIDKGKEHTRLRRCDGQKNARRYD
jgi:hypothetical protein